MNKIYYWLTLIESIFFFFNYKYRTQLINISTLFIIGYIFWVYFFHKYWTDIIIQDIYFSPNKYNRKHQEELHACDTTTCINCPQIELNYNAIYIIVGWESRGSWWIVCGVLHEGTSGLFHRRSAWANHPEDFRCMEMPQQRVPLSKFTSTKIRQGFS